MDARTGIYARISNKSATQRGATPSIFVHSRRVQLLLVAFGAGTAATEAEPHADTDEKRRAEHRGAQHGCMAVETGPRLVRDQGIDRHGNDPLCAFDERVHIHHGTMDY
jgi:hypothetical protein